MGPGVYNQGLSEPGKQGTHRASNKKKGGCCGGTQSADGVGGRDKQMRVGHCWGKCGLDRAVAGMRLLPGVGGMGSPALL